ncbi:hypothetical protein C8Q70DRAFT_1028718 [Cubamyces menziesii]|uniref:Uncharacterized protein n=1 Tax=Trametes cubensis TaxID=1111947 RepID=A0AAD7TF30_9APHY|nr:hypothetical protein C8Q70DRAFT_1028718 [Cubamyces menziesii]KAJ8453465.1 hypothetical protein ONZ51_g13583 [Trametes cubensis]
MLSRYDTLPVISDDKQGEKSNGDYILAPALSRSPTELLNEAAKQFPDLPSKSVERTMSAIAQECEPEWANWDDEEDVELPDDEQSESSAQSAPLMKNGTPQRLATTSGLSQSSDHMSTQDSFSQFVREWESGPANSLEHAPLPKFLTSTVSPASYHSSRSGSSQGVGIEEEQMDGVSTALTMDEGIDIKGRLNSRYATPAPSSPPASSSAKTPVRRQAGMDDLRKQFTQDAESLGRAPSYLSSDMNPAVADGERPPAATPRRSRRIQGRKLGRDI